VAGSPELCREVEAVIRTTLTAKSDDAKLLADARDMREKLGSQFPGKSRWDLKFAPGGLVDLEFIAQALQLRIAHRRPDALDTNTIGALGKLSAAGALEQADADILIAAAKFQQALMQILRIAVDGTLEPLGATAGLKTLLARAGGVRDFPELERQLVALQDRAHDAFVRLLG
jgi:glutamate-ammonia-ligase adenylyltransferase